MATYILVGALSLVVGAVVAWVVAGIHRRTADAAPTTMALRDTFTALSAQALQANNQAFLDLAKTALGEHQQMARADLDARRLSIDQLVKPVHEGLQRVDEKLQQLDKERASSHAALHEHLRLMGESQHQLADETATLVRALRAPPGARPMG